MVGKLRCQPIRQPHIETFRGKLNQLVNFVFSKQLFSVSKRAYLLVSSVPQSTIGEQPILLNTPYYRALRYNNFFEVSIRPR
jgi:hypothetical protein